MRTTLFSAAIIVCAALSLTPKVFSAVALETPRNSAASVPHTLATELSTQGYRRMGARQLSNDGVHTAVFYGSEACQGWVSIVRLFRNTEGAHLMSALFGTDTGRLSYVYEGQHYEDYPVLRTGMRAFFDLPTILTGGTRVTSPVYLIFETDNCRLETK